MPVHHPNTHQARKVTEVAARIKDLKAAAYAALGVDPASVGADAEAAIDEAIDVLLSAAFRRFPLG